MASLEDESLDLSELSADDKEALANVLKQHIDNYDRVVTGEETLTIPDEVAAKIRDRVINSVKLGDLGAEVIRFGTIGFVKVCIAILEPALNPKKYEKDVSDQNTTSSDV